MDRSHAEKQGDFQHRMEHHVDHPRRQAGRGQGGHPQQDIGEVADGGPGQPPLQMLGTQGLGGAVGDGKHGRPHDQVLGPAAPNEVRPIAVPGQAGHREHPSLHHRHRMEQGGHRRGGHGGPQQPPVPRENRCLHTEAKKSKHISCPQGVFLAS